MSIYTKETLEQPIDFSGQIIREVSIFNGRLFNEKTVSLSNCQGYTASVSKDRKLGFYSSAYVRGISSIGILLPEVTDVTDEDINKFIYAVGMQVKKDEN